MPFIPDWKKMEKYMTKSRSPAEEILSTAFLQIFNRNFEELKVECPTKKVADEISNILCKRGYSKGYSNKGYSKFKMTYEFRKKITPITLSHTSDDDNVDNVDNVDDDNVDNVDDVDDIYDGDDDDDVVKVWFITISLVQTKSYRGDSD